MDTLIEMIVQALIALFTDSRQKKTLPPPVSVRKIPPMRTTPPAMAGRPRQNVGSPRGQKITARPAARTQKGFRPPPIPQAAVAAQPVARAAAAPAAVHQDRSAFSASAIRKLVLSRRSAMRSIYVLSEVVGPPIALR